MGTVKDTFIKGTLDLSRVTFSSPVMFANCTFDDIELTAAKLPQLSLRGCEVKGALSADHLSVTDGDLDLEEFRGSVSLAGAHIRDDLHLQGARLGAKGRDRPYSLNAPNLRVGGNLYCGTPADLPYPHGHRGKRRFFALGPLYLEDARIEGVVVFDRSILSSAAQSDFALYGEGMTVDGAVYMRRILCFGQVNLVGCRIGGELNLRRALISCSRKCRALMLDRTHVSGSIFGERLMCTGELTVNSGTIDAGVYLNGADLKSTDEASLVLNRAVIGGDLRMAQRFRARTSTTDDDQRTPAVSLVAAHVGGQVIVDLTGIESSSKVVVDLSRLTATSLLLMRKQKELKDDRQKEVGDDTQKEVEDGRPILNFTQARISSLTDSGTRRERRAAGGNESELDKKKKPLEYRAILKDFRYEAIDMDVAVGDRLSWLQESCRRTPRPASSKGHAGSADTPQPYDQLAAAYNAAGRDADARHILYEKNKNTWQRTGLWQRVWRYPWNLAQRALIGYGYKPLRAFLTIVTLWALGVFAFWKFPPVPQDGQHGMTAADHVVYPLDLMVPVVGIGERTRFHPHAGGTEWFSIILIVMGWLISATIIAAIARVTKRP